MVVRGVCGLGILFEKRAQRTCEYLEVMRKLWNKPKSSFNGEFVRFDGVRNFPKPPQGTRLPVIFGGESMPALRRVARMGNGWFGVKLNPEQAAAKIATLRSLMTEAGRDIAELEIIISPYENQVTAEDLRAYHEIGVAEFVPFDPSPRRRQQNSRSARAARAAMGRARGETSLASANSNVTSFRLYFKA